VTIAPTAKAAAKRDKWIAKMTSAEIHDKWERATKAVTLENWKADMLELGIARISGGIDRAKEKVTAFAEKLIAHQNAKLPEIARMPDITLEDTKARMLAWFEHMAKFKYK